MRFEIFPPPKTTLTTFTISPDGRKIVINARGADGRSSLWLRTMDSLQMRELPGTQNPNLDVAWSPDSQSIAFMAEGSVKRIDLAGGAPQTLAPYGAPSSGISWSPQDVILYSSGGILSRVAASGGEAAPVTAIDLQRGEQAHGRPLFLPDGKHFLYYQLAGKQENIGIYAGSIDAKPADQGKKRLLDTPAGVVYVDSPGKGPGTLLFLRGAALMAQPFDANRLELIGPARSNRRPGE